MRLLAIAALLLGGCTPGLVPCQSHSQCAAPKRCDRVIGLCIVPRAAGAPCQYDDQCVTGQCSQPAGAEEPICD